MAVAGQIIRLLRLFKKKPTPRFDALAIKLLALHVREATNTNSFWR